jgi:hypothetical protein
LSVTTASTSTTRVSVRMTGGCCLPGWSCAGDPAANANPANALNTRSFIAYLP